MAKSMREISHELPVPEGHRVEIIEGAIDVSPRSTGKHGRTVWRLAKMPQSALPEHYDFETNLGGQGPRQRRLRGPRSLRRP